MSLFLSRLCLNPLFAPALKLATDPYELHRKLLDTLACGPRPKPATGNQPNTAELLFRIDSDDDGPFVLLQTNAAPEWGALELARRALRRDPETKPYDPKFALGQRLAFRLLSQPLVRKSGQFGLRPNGKRVLGPRRACRDDEQRLAWLQRKADAGGFGVETVGLTLVEWRNTKPLQAKGGHPIESREEGRRRAFGPGPAQRLGAVRFDGILQVTDPILFLKTLRAGIGSAKGLGFGLLSLARPEASRANAS
jgi:CRISPR system Cascade subunit CasE